MTPVINWLLEPDNPSVRYFTLRHLLDRPENDGETQAARRAIMDSHLIYCLNGNLLWALTALGCGRDERVARALDWLTGMITGELPRTGSYSWPGFGCGANDKLPCAWGAVKALRTLANLPPALQSPKVEKAKAATVDHAARPARVEGRRNSDAGEGELI
jgi:hypothetical protein